MLKVPALDQEDLGAGVRFIGVSSDLDAEAQEIVCALHEVVRFVTIRSRVDARRVAVEEKLDPLARLGRGRIGLRQLREQLAEWWAHCELCRAPAGGCFGRDLFGRDLRVRPRSPRLELGDEQIGHLARDRMLCQLDLSPRLLEAVLDILATHLFQLQQASDVSPELMVNAFVCTEDGTLGKPVSGFMGLS